MDVIGIIIIALGFYAMTVLLTASRTEPLSPFVFWTYYGIQGAALIALLFVAIFATAEPMAFAFVAWTIAVLLWLWQVFMAKVRVLKKHKLYDFKVEKVQQRIKGRYKILRGFVKEGPFVIRGISIIKGNPEEPAKDVYKVRYSLHPPRRLNYAYRVEGEYLSPEKDELIFYFVEENDE